MASSSNAIKSEPPDEDCKPLLEEEVMFENSVVKQETYDSELKTDIINDVIKKEPHDDTNEIGNTDDEIKIEDTEFFVKKEDIDGAECASSLVTVQENENFVKSEGMEVEEKFEIDEDELSNMEMANTTAQSGSGKSNTRRGATARRVIQKLKTKQPKERLIKILAKQTQIPPDPLEIKKVTRSIGIQTSICQSPRQMRKVEKCDFGAQTPFEGNLASVREMESEETETSETPQYLYILQPSSQEGSGSEVIATNSQQTVYSIAHAVFDKPVPPRPHLTVRKEGRGVRLRWDMPYDLDLYESIASYQVYAVRQSEMMNKKCKWKKLCTVPAVDPPIACIVTDLDNRDEYSFAICPIDVRGRNGFFSKPERL